MFLELIRQRRSVRKFTSQPIDPKNRKLLIESALRAPSSRGFNPWRFVMVEDAILLEKLSRAKPHGAAFLKHAPLGIVVCAEASASDVWVEDCSVASAFIHLAAASLGMGSCWIQIRKRNHSPSLSADTYIKDLLKIPDTLMIESIIAIGYPDETKNGHPSDGLEYDKVFFNQFGKKE